MSNREERIEKLRATIRHSRAGQALFLELVPEILDAAYESIAEHLDDNDIGDKYRFEVDWEKTLSSDPAKQGHPIKPKDYK